ncbi:hypothetical protein E2C01_100196 [Portunus trituberculatus]|uniref:Uncharacterized protein n=1 Tax=Portunus trituberculatus TaxID=210409 RepID=A0A5B7K7E4_PORTR|nr:hypothetical protein [Portunus trituberculatus]
MPLRPLMPVTKRNGDLRRRERCYCSEHLVGTNNLYDGGFKVKFYGRASLEAIHKEARQVVIGRAR